MQLATNAQLSMLNSINETELIEMMYTVRNYNLRK